MEITHEQNYSELIRDGIKDVKPCKLFNEYLQIKNIIYVLERFFSLVEIQNRTKQMMIKHFRTLTREIYQKRYH